MSEEPGDSVTLGNTSGVSQANLLLFDDVSIITTSSYLPSSYSPVLGVVNLGSDFGFGSLPPRFISRMGVCFYEMRYSIT